jgi:phosphoserine phosphatase RsbX
VGHGRVSARSSALVEVGTAQWTLDGESGDAYLVEPFPGGVLLGVVDGLGHGPDAAAVARTATAVLAANAAEEPSRLLELCHEALSGSRGVVASVASVREQGSLAWVGVGNVDAEIISLRGDRLRRVLTLRGGVLGDKLPRLRTAVLPIAPGELIVFATDGIAGSALEALDARAPAEITAERILASGCKGSDDALVVVARYLGNGG